MFDTFISTIDLPLPNESNPSAWAREQLQLGWSQVLVFTTAVVGILSVVFILRTLRR